MKENELDRLDSLWLVGLEFVNVGYTYQKEYNVAMQYIKHLVLGGKTLASAQ